MVTIFNQSKSILTSHKPMRVQPENYKGIVFVRISALPEDQKKNIWHSLGSDKIIKILKDDCLLNDCVQFEDYQNWYVHFRKHIQVNSSTVQSPTLKWAFK